MSWKNILKEESVKRMVEDALDLHSRGRDFYKETYTKEDIKHHLYGFISVKKNFSVGIWHELAALGVTIQLNFLLHFPTENSLN